jgi:hypothetical protein
LLSRGESGLSRHELDTLLGPERYDYKIPVHNAVAAVLRVVGPQGELAEKRARLMYDLFAELQSSTGHGWNFIHARLADGSYAFRAPDQPVMVIVRHSDGALFRAAPPKVPLGQWTPDYGDPGIKELK